MFFSWVLANGDCLKYFIQCYLSCTNFSLFDFNCNLYKHNFTLCVNELLKCVIEWERERARKHYSLRHFILKFDYNIAIKEEMVLEREREEWEWKRPWWESSTQYCFWYRDQRLWFNAYSNGDNNSKIQKWTMASMSMCHHCEALAGASTKYNSIEACVLHRGSENRSFV